MAQIRSMLVPAYYKGQARIILINDERAQVCSHKARRKVGTAVAEHALMKKYSEVIHRAACSNTEIGSFSRECSTNKIKRTQRRGSRPKR